MNGDVLDLDVLKTKNPSFERNATFPKLDHKSLTCQE
jgi:hypothetical protein